jgi:hypothetical protein
MSHEVEQEQSIEHLDFTIPCQSVRCRTEWGRGDHDADWLMILTCGCSVYVCHDRLSFNITVLAMGKGLRCRRCESEHIRIATQHRLH